MKTIILQWSLICIGILLMFNGAILGNMVVEKHSDSHGTYSTGKVVVSMTKEAAADSNNLLTVMDVEKLSLQPGTGVLAATAESSMSVSCANRSVASIVRGVSSNYTYFLSLDILEGNFLSGADEKETNHVAVIDEELALELFKTSHVIGNEIEIYDRYFKIIGVIAKDPSILGILTNQKEPVVYIPVKTMLELDGKAGISLIQVKTIEEDLLGRNQEIVSAAMRAISKEPSKYIIEDYDIKAFFLRQKIKLAVFIPGSILILLMLVILKNSIKRLVLILSSGCKTDYFADVLRIHKLDLSAELIRSGLLLGGVASVWSGISFRFFIPQDYIPEELIDLSYYIDLVKDLIVQSNSRMGYLPVIEEAILIKTQKLVDWMFYMGVIAGIPMMMIGLYQLKLKETSLSVMVAGGSIMTVVATVFVLLEAIAAGMPLSLDTKGLLVLFAFVFINSIIFSKERDEVF